MPISVVRQRNRGTNATSDVPYYTFDQSLAPGTEINREMAVNAVFAQGLIDADGAEPYDYDYEQLSHHSAMIRLLYQNQGLSPTAPPLPPPLEVGSAAVSFNAVSFQSVHKTHSLKTKWGRPGPAFPGYGANGAPPDFEGLVDVQEWKGLTDAPYGGYTLQLPPETHVAEYVIPNATMTAEYENVISNLLWRVHGGPGTFFRRNPGEVMLVRAQSRQRTADDLHLTFGFSYRANGPRKIGNVSTADLVNEPPVEGHDLVWACMGIAEVTAAIGITVRVPFPRWIYGEEIWERGDLNLLGLPGSAD